MRHLLLAISLLFSCSLEFAEAANRPNIVIVYGDDIGYGDLSCYGATGVNTPNVDAIAARGVRFRSGYCSAATCTPSRYSLLTGEYAFRNEGAVILPGNAPLIIDPSQPTIASFLQDNGYATALVGKWHLGLGTAEQPLDWNGVIQPGPKEVGFEYSFHMAATADRVPSVYIENGRIVGLDPNDPVTVSYREQVGKEPTGISHPQLLKVQADEQHSGTIINGISRIGFMSGGKKARFTDENMADDYLGKAIDFIERQQDKPFFLYFAPNENHVPRVVHPRFQGSTSLGPRGDAVATFDWCVGRIVETLKATGQYKDTMIIISSDNGPVLFDGYWDGAMENSGEHKAAGPWRGGKYSRWEGGTRVPFIVSWPARMKRGISEALISQVDLLATFAALLEESLPEQASTDGKNVLPALLGESSQGRDYIVQEALKQLAVRHGNWKYLPPGTIKERNGLDQWTETKVPSPGFLFNLSEDPGEATNLAHRYPNKVKQLREILGKVAPNRLRGTLWNLKRD